ncbi:O-antigen ligase [Microbacterium sp. Bi128]|uniref:O-antigen ligase family protein n=1 Tax=Microbacterium sp. Bi128 TaxID=2821115 RepID=UPI001DF0DA59|nr:O-antigen ligase family protein [Microbacterium sp. Bi128]CAH0148007.1 hypothetical protein SRABI128_00468 [Microbacterium sp. Bi128]
MSADRSRTRPDPRPVLASAELARAFTIASFAAVFGASAIRGLTGDVTYATVLTGLCALGVAMLIVRRREIEVLHLAPTTLVVFVVWAGASVLWSTDAARTTVGWAGLVGVSFLGVVIGHVRDAHQSVRALGDVLRWLLAASLALEVLSGILWDTPIPFLGIRGDITELGPVQGLFGSRNDLGVVTVIALLTFLVEWRTRSVRPATAAASVALSVGLALLSGSPTVVLVAVVTAVAAAALAAVRTLAPRRRRAAQLTLGVAVLAALALAWAQRAAIASALDGRDDLSLRTDLWGEILRFSDDSPVHGFGWFGPWPPDTAPFSVLNFGLDQQHASALNAYLDVLLQLGWAGLLVFLVLCALALARAWLVAGERRAVVHTWAPLTLVALMTVSLFESSVLSGAGLLLLVLCAVRAGQSRSWRERLGDRAAPAPGVATGGADAQGRPDGAG